MIPSTLAYSLAFFLYLYSNDLVHRKYLGCVVGTSWPVTMSFEEKLKRFMALYEDMEKKMAQEDLFNKEFTVSCVITQNIAML